MASKKSVTVNGKTMSMAPTEADLADLEKLLRSLQEDVDKARDDGRIFMMQEYVRLVALVSPEINRIQARFKREILAESRKEQADMKATARLALIQQKEAEEEAAAKLVRDRHAASQKANA